ncbi:MAG: membrane protein insertase YidC [Gammaproteobacteria bacterium]|nr:membrane protein insertase YidC [Gammaproteobacteria bacterium]MDE0225837.1 membrane protein insertase YidC [Gammaproteobacteria bacterium]MDE0450983.1 membrane protein insertase YidC [Gammaproteobacteria bacterium]
MTLPSTEIQRIALLVALGITAYLLMLAWQQDYGRPPVKPVESPVAEERGALPDMPSAEDEAAEYDFDVPVPTSVAEPVDAVEATDPALERARLIEVSTPTMTAWIDPVGGDIVGVRLPRYPVSLDQPDAPFVLLDRRVGHTYIAQSGLAGPDGIDSRSGRPHYIASRRSYRVEDTPEEVVLRHEEDGLIVEKRFRFDPESYLVDVAYEIDNRRAEPMTANLFAQLKRDASLPETGQGFTLGPRPYLGAALTTVDTRYEKVDFEDLRDEELLEVVTGGWIAMLQHYFLSAWVANPNQENTYYGYPNRRGDGTYIVGFTGPAFTVAPGGTAIVGAGFYAGPKDQNRLEEIAPNLNLTVDYGFLWFLAAPLFRLLEIIQSFAYNWGVAIILMTLVIKIILYPLSHASYKSMAKMRKLAPQMKRLQERHAGDRQKLSQEMMELYRKEKANPLGGCIPMVLQMPVLIAMYWVLYESVELRQAPFFGWVQDLSAMDPFFVLPILMGASTYAQQLLSPTPPDPMMARMMKMMPIMFTVLFIFFPAGLVLYWLVNNLLSMAQQWFTNYRIEKAESA